MYRWAWIVWVLWVSTAVEASVFEGGLGERAGPAVVAFDMVRERDTTSRRLRRRKGEVELTLENGLEAAVNPYAQYYTNISVGTPPQIIKVQLDTGSNDLLLNTPSSAFCQTNSALCAGATYNANDSSTYHFLSSNASLGYGGGDNSSGDYVTDTLSFNGAVLKDVQMILSYDTTTRDSIWGLSYSTGEQGIYYGEPEYPSISSLMVSSGAIKSNAYSLYLNSQTATTGSLLFGGVNTAHYTGHLHTIPIEMNPNYTHISSFIVTVTGISLTLPSSSSSTPQEIPLISDRADPYLIDSGTYNIEMPLSLLTPIFAALGAEYEPASQFAMVPCALAQNSSTLNFHFSSFAIAIPLSELIFPQSFLAYSTYIPTLSDGSTPACLLGLSPAGEDFILGDTFMRSAYIVFDLANDEISLAQANLDGAGPDAIVEIGTGAASVPGATKVPNPVRAWPNETAIANYDVPATGKWSYYEDVSTATAAASSAPREFGTTGVVPVGTQVTLEAQPVVTLLSTLLTTESSAGATGVVETVVTVVTETGKSVGGFTPTGTGALAAATATGAQSGAEGRSAGWGLLRMGVLSAVGVWMCTRW